METQPSLLTLTGLDIQPQSLVVHNGCEYAMTSARDTAYLMVLVPNRDPRIADFEGNWSEWGDWCLLKGAKSPRNAAALRGQLPWLNPGLMGLNTSAGMGDRLGLATPGHIRAVRKFEGLISPVFAQQSIREMQRTGRTPQQVMDDATWGIFQENWKAGMGADADHLKTTDDLDACLDAGFTFFTIDPGENVSNAAVQTSAGELLELTGSLPTELQPRKTGLIGRTLIIEDKMLTVNEEMVLRAAVKYGRAILHTAALYRHLVSQAGNRPFELEVSVDETEQPTSLLEHVYIAMGLKRLGVNWVSLAPRFVGRFEKGVDYIGDPLEFEKSLAGHAAIARQFGPYKLSLHSGSDKFSIYPAAMRQTQGLVHLKTAGTSYLEALRTIAAADPELFIELYRFACERYETDRMSYHVSAELSRSPAPDSVSQPLDLLEQFDAREILHVTFGSVLTQKTGNGSRRFYSRFMAVLQENCEAYAVNLEKHFIRHLQPFANIDS